MMPMALQRDFARAGPPLGHSEGIGDMALGGMPSGGWQWVPLNAWALQSAIGRPHSVGILFPVNRHARSALQSPPE